MAVVYLALGSNLGGRKDNIKQAIKHLNTQFKSLVVASFYCSRAVGYTKQPDFINTVVRCKTELSVDDLLTLIKSVEKSVGRIERFRWGPREIDIDIIFYDKLVMSRPDLTIPHPRFADRDFVLRPLCDIDPDFIDPYSKKTLSQLLQNIPEEELSVISRLET